MGKITDRYNQLWDGAYYQQHSSPQYHFAMEALKSINLKEHKRILDIGCGSGEVTAEIARSLAHIPESFVVGIDASQNMIDVARKTYSDVTNMDFMALDAQDLPFVNEFDLVVSFFCLHWIADQQRVLHSIARGLKPLGLMLTAMPGKADNHPLFVSFVEVIGQPQWAIYHQVAQDQQQFFFQDSATFGKMVGAAGLVPSYNQLTIKKRIFPTVAHLNAWLTGWIGGLPAIAALPEELRVKFIDDLMHHYKKHVSVNVDRSIEFSLPLLITKATKGI
jgi:trans-aconitate 2-methyltransferase